MVPPSPQGCEWVNEGQISLSASYFTFYIDWLIDWFVKLWLLIAGVRSYSCCCLITTWNYRNVVNAVGCACKIYTVQYPRSKLWSNCATSAVLPVPHRMSIRASQFKTWGSQGDIITSQCIYRKWKENWFGTAKALLLEAIIFESTLLHMFITLPFKKIIMFLKPFETIGTVRGRTKMCESMWSLKRVD